jgi:hypothetical protein
VLTRLSVKETGTWPIQSGRSIAGFALNNPAARTIPAIAKEESSAATDQASASSVRQGLDPTRLHQFRGMVSTGHFARTAKSNMGLCGSSSWFREVTAVTLRASYSYSVFHT